VCCRFISLFVFSIFPLPPLLRCFFGLETFPLRCPPPPRPTNPLPFCDHPPLFESFQISRFTTDDPYCFFEFPQTVIVPSSFPFLAPPLLSKPRVFFSGKPPLFMVGPTRCFPPSLCSRLSSQLILMEKINLVRGFHLFLQPSFSFSPFNCFLSFHQRCLRSVAVRTRVPCFLPPFTSGAGISLFPPPTYASAIRFLPVSLQSFCSLNPVCPLCDCNFSSSSF